MHWLLLVALADVWTEPYPGVRHLERTTSTLRAHVVTVDLDRPTVRVRATRYADREQTVTAFAAQYGCEVAVNGDFFEYGTYLTKGLAMGDGVPWPGTADGARWGFVGVGGGRVDIAAPADVSAPAAWMTDIVGFYPLLVAAGSVTDAAHCSSDFCGRNPRTAVGVTEDGRALILAVVDGRSTSSLGLSLAGTAELMVEMGAWRAGNLDGGGSSALVIGGAVVNRPSDGRERVVANHVCIDVDGAAPEPPPEGLPPPAPALEPDTTATVVEGGCRVAGGGGPAWLLVLLGWARRRGR